MSCKLAQATPLQRALGKLPALALALVACGPPAKPAAPPPRQPPPDVNFTEVQLQRPKVHELSFTPSRTYQGLQLTFSLFDQEGLRLTTQTVAFGPLFEKGAAPIQAGRVNARELTLSGASAAGMRVISRRRVSRAGPRGLDLSRARTARLESARRCRKEKYKWRPGMPVPHDLPEVPQMGDTLERVACNRAVLDAKLQRSFRYEQVPHPHRGVLRAVVEFNRDFLKGVSFVVQPIEADGKPHPYCSLQVEQPIVYEAQSKTYKVPLQGTLAVGAFSRAKKLRAVHVRPFSAEGRYLEIRVYCRRDKYVPAERRVWKKTKRSRKKKRGKRKRKKGRGAEASPP